MRIELVAGPGLYSICHSDPQVWARSLVDWRDALQRLGLRPRLAQDCWVAASQDECLASFELVQQTLGVDSGLAGALLQVLASLLGLIDPYAPDVVLYEWTSSGCLQRNGCRSSTREVVTVAASLQPRRVGIVAAELDETELVDVEQFDQDSDDLRTVDVSFNVVCLPSPVDLLDELDPADYVDRPEVAIAIVLDRIFPEGGDRPAFHVLPELASSLTALSSALKRSAIETMAASLLPANSRPRGLEEHAIRTGPGGNDPQVRSRWGNAFRATISKRGAGWRLHYWRGLGVVTFSNVCMHESVEIFE